MVMLIQPGPTDTAKAAGFKAKEIKMARPIDVPKRIVHSVNEVVEKYKVNFYIKITACIK